MSTTEVEFAQVLPDNPLVVHGDRVAHPRYRVRRP